MFSTALYRNCVRSARLCRTSGRELLWVAARNHPIVVHGVSFRRGKRRLLLAIPLELTRPNAPAKCDVVGTLVLSILASHRRHAHITCLRSDGVSPDLLGMKRIVSEDAIRRHLSKIDESRGIAWLRRHLDDVSGRCCASPGSSTWTRRSSRSTGTRREQW